LIHYHGGPITPAVVAAQLYRGRHVLVSYAEPRDIELVATVASSFVLDNGAYTFWKRGGTRTAREKTAWIGGYEKFVEVWCDHPGCDWHLIPDIVDGTEDDNDGLLLAWPHRQHGVAVWHMHESLARLERLIELALFDSRRLAIWSSGAFASVGTSAWWNRMHEAMWVLTNLGRQRQPVVKVHGLRMLNPAVFSKFPFASADSSTVARNIGLDQNWTGTYVPRNRVARGAVLMSRIEESQSADYWGGDACVHEDFPHQIPLWSVTGDAGLDDRS
jgi:hypothetical protein